MSTVAELRKELTKVSKDLADEIEKLSATRNLAAVKSSIEVQIERMKSDIAKNEALLARRERIQKDRAANAPVEVKLPEAGWSKVELDLIQMILVYAHKYGDGFSVSDAQSFVEHAAKIEGDLRLSTLLAIASRCRNATGGLADVEYVRHAYEAFEASYFTGLASNVLSMIRSLRPEHRGTFQAMAKRALRSKISRVELVAFGPPEVAKEVRPAVESSDIAAPGSLSLENES